MGDIGVLNRNHGAVLLKKLIVAQMVKKFSTLYGSLSFITVFTRTRRSIWMYNIKIGAREIGCGLDSTGS